MKNPFLPLVLAVSLGSSATQAQAQIVQNSIYSDPRTPQGTLRSFVAALGKNDLTKAASYIADPKTNANLPEIARAMQQHRINYSINHLRLATSGDSATIAFYFAVDDLPAKATYESWVKLRRVDSLWKIDPAQTFQLSESVDPFASFISLMSGQKLAGEERDDLEMRGAKMMALGTVLLSFVQQNGGRFALQASELRGALLPLRPSVDVLLRPAPNSDSKVSFNAKLANLSLKKVRFPDRTIMLYNGQDERLNFNWQGRASITLVDGNVLFVDAQTAKMLLLWTP